MAIGLVGKKQGMTRVFTPEGDAIAVTVISVQPNTITQIKLKDDEGYSSVQVTTGTKKEKHLRMSEIGHFKKNSINPGEGLWEFRISDEQINDRFFDRIDDARSDTASRKNVTNSIEISIENDRLSDAAFQASESSRQLIDAADQRRKDLRAAELSAQVQQQFDLLLAGERLASAQNDPSQPRGSLVDIFA